MRRSCLVAVALLLSAGAASAATTQKWTAGWDNFHEPLNYKTSNVSWSVKETTRKLSVTYTLVGATPNKLYQVAIGFFCTPFPATFGQFPTSTSGGPCEAQTRQGVTKTVSGIWPGVVTTEIHGNGSFAVVMRLVS